MIDMSVKDMTDQQLNVALAELTGFPADKLTPNYCNDAAASLEVQAKALEIDADTYIRHLGELICDRAADHYKNNSIAKLLNAPSRQRAEAAYMTLSSKDLHPLREDQWYAGSI